MNNNNNKMILSIQEAERQRIARDLHDISLQNITHIIHQIELYELYLTKDPIKANIELMSIKQKLKSVVDEIRDIIFDLRPMTFDDLGLKETFEAFFYNLKNTTDFTYELDIEPVKSENQNLLLNIYRIVVECVYNSVKHSNASNICFTCKSDSQYCYLWIEDNGIGFSKDILNTKKNHFGLAVMNERVKILNGKIEFVTEIGKGTKVFISVPLV